MFPRAGEPSGTRPEYIPIEVLLKMVEMQIPKDILTTGMPEKYANWWRRNYAFLIAAAINTRRLAQSPRDFFVGGSLGYWDKGLDQGDFVTDANFKMTSNQKSPRMCAERRTLRQLHLKSLIEQKNRVGKSFGLSEATEPNLDVMGLVVASDQTDTTQPGEKPEVAYQEKRETLHPCDQCFDLLSSDNLIKPWTRIITVNDTNRDGLVIEDIDVEELLRQHGLTKNTLGGYEEYLKQLMPDLKLS